jgi:DNA-binding transcriptional MerR regulator
VPTVADYARLAPFTIDELTDAANSILRHRPRLQVLKRTTRYYITEGVLPPPSGSPKFARYGVEHLLRLIGAKCLQDEGKSLEEVKLELDRLLRETDAAELVQQWVAGRGMTDLPTLRETPMPWQPSSPRHQSLELQSVARVRLSHDLVLEIPAQMPPVQALTLAREAIERMLRDST